MVAPKNSEKQRAAESSPSAPIAGRMMGAATPVGLASRADHAAYWLSTPVSFARASLARSTAQHEVRNHSPRLLAGILLAAGLFVLGGQRASADDLATIKQRGTLLVGVKADYPPFGFRSSSGEIVGIEPALAEDVAKSLGVKLELVPVVASNRIEFLEQGKIDLIIATMNDTFRAGRWWISSNLITMLPATTSWCQNR